MDRTPRLLRVTAWLLLAALLPAPASTAQAPPPDAELVAGMRQVQEGDFETAVVTLGAVVQRLQGIPSRSRDLLEAYVHLGVAEVALDRRESARARFAAALALNRELRLGADRFSPKVLAVFEEARVQMGGASKAKSGTAATPILLAGLAGAAAAGVVLATRGGAEPAASGRVSFGNPRFAVPEIVCPDNSADVILPFAILIDAANGTAEPVTLGTPTVAMTIRSSPGLPEEVGFVSNRAARVLPPAILPARNTTTISVESSFLCGNGPGGPGRFNEWTGQVTLGSLQGFETLEVTGRLRVNLP
jgi:hypothetical protein